MLAGLQQRVVDHLKQRLAAGLIRIDLPIWCVCARVCVCTSGGECVFVCVHACVRVSVCVCTRVCVRQSE